MKLWLTGVSTAKRVAGIKAIRTTGELLPLNPGALHTLKGAYDAWKLVNEGVGKCVYLGETDDEPTMKKAVAALQSGGCDFSLGEDPPLPVAEVRISAGEQAADFANAAADAAASPEVTVEFEEPDLPSFEATRAAMVLMAATDGKPIAALVYARALGRATGQVDIFDDAAAYILHCFPPAPGTEQQLLDLTNPDGPRLAD